MEKFHWSEIWRATKAVGDTKADATADEMHAWEPDSDEELVSGSAQAHSVFNLAELAHVMDDAYIILHSLLPLHSMVNHIGPLMKGMFSCERLGYLLNTHQCASTRKWQHESSQAGTEKGEICVSPLLFFLGIIL